MAENLVTRNGTYYVRMQAPKALQELRKSLGKTGTNDVWRSLGTKDRTEAKARFPLVLLEIQQAFEAEKAALLRAVAKPPKPPLVVPDEHALQSAVFHFIRAELHQDEVQRINRPTFRQAEMARARLVAECATNPPSSALEAVVRVLSIQCPEEIAAWESEKRERLAEELKQCLARNEFALVDWAIAELAHTNHWAIEPDSLTYKQLGRMLIKGWLQVLSTARKRDQGLYEEPDSSLLVSPVPTHAPTVAAANEGRAIRKLKKGEGLRDYFEDYLKEARAGLRPNGLKDSRATIRQFIECAGDKPVTEYTRSDVARFKRLLSQAPARSEKLFPGVPLPKAVELNRKAGKPLMKDATVRNKLSILSAFGKWLEGNVDGVDASNFQTTLPPRKNSNRMNPFTDDEVRRILNAPSFVGCESEKNQSKPGSHRIRDWRFWLPLVQAFTGARLNEVTQLKVEDLSKKDGVWGFFISDGDGRSLKTESSKRWVPMHSKLEELGLLDYREKTAAAGHSDLWPDIPLTNGRRSDRAGKWFRGFLTRIGVKGEGDLGGSHRWRHTIADALRRGGVDEHEIAQLLGHSYDVAKMTSHYGLEAAITPARRRELIERVCYPSVDFSLLTDTGAPGAP